MEAFAWFADNGREAPEEIRPPDLLPGAQWVLEAFLALMGDRPAGFGLAPIPFSAVAGYARLYGLSDPDDFEPFIALIQMMDSVWMQAVKARDS